MTVLEGLQTKIREANEAYWAKAKPIMSDTAYDELVEKLRKLNPNDPLLTTVVGDKTSGQKVRHQEHMYSLGKCYTFDDVLNWMGKYARSEDELIDAQPKMDGLSMELINGRLITRGNGEIGTDVSHLIPFIGVIMDLRKGLEVGGNSIIQDQYWGKKRIVGELLIFNKRFRRFKSTRPGCAEYKSPRNMVAGFCNLKPDQATALANSLGLNQRVATLVWHDAFSITMPLKELRKKIASVADKLNGAKDLPCDGIVFKYHDREFAKSLGFTGHHPLGACAYKFKADEADVVIKQIVWQVGERHVNPVAIFDPVELESAMIERATLHCKDFVVDTNACVGSHATIIRQGSVIPKVIDVSTPKGLVCELPKTCPECGEPLIEEGAYLSCKNDACPGRVTNQIVRGLKAFGLLGVGPALARKAVGEFYITSIMGWAQEFGENTPEKIEFLKKKNFTASEIVSLLKFADVMKNGATASTILKSVCIENVGDMFINAINKYCGGVEKLMKVCPVDNMYTYLVDHPGVNMDALTAFMLWQELHHEEFMDYMHLFKIIPEETQDDGIAEAEGCVCFTGEGPKPRKELAAIAKTMGFAVTDNANLCGVLVCADPNGNSSKLKKARAKGKLIMSYADFFKEKLT